MFVPDNVILESQDVQTLTLIGLQDLQFEAGVHLTQSEGFFIS